MCEPRFSHPVSEVDGVEEKSDLVAGFEKLSAPSQSSFKILLQNLARGDAILKTDKDGKQYIEYQQKQINCKKKAHPSHANKIVKPKTDADVQCKVEACLELIDFVKNGKNPAGVSLDSTKIQIQNGKYREGHEFTRTKEILGHGLFGGDIFVVKDNKTNQSHALKTIMVSVFRKEEIQCWVDLSETGYVPSLYLFKIKDDMVEVHMEILRESLTMQKIIDDHLEKLDHSLRKTFSLCVLNGTLEAVSAIHGKNWVHNDLHEGNLMLQKSEKKVLQLKIIDFGRASKYEDPDTGFDHRGFRSDLRNIIGMYCSVFCGSKIFDFHLPDWEADIGNQLPEMSEIDRFEVLYLVKLAMDVVQPKDIPDYQGKVKEHLDKALNELNKTETDILREVVGILFPETNKKMDQDILDEADGTGDQTTGGIATPKFAAKQLSDYKQRRSGPTVVADELIDQLHYSMCLGPTTE